MGGALENLATRIPKATAVDNNKIKGHPKTYATLAELEACDAAYLVAGNEGTVYNDADPEKNGNYVLSDDLATWSKSVTGDADISKYAAAETLEETDIAAGQNPDKSMFKYTFSNFYNWIKTKLDLIYVAKVADKSLVLDTEITRLEAMDTNKETNVATVGIIVNQATPTSTLRFTGASAVTISGFAGGSNGKSLLIINLTSADLTLQHMNAGSSAGNRLFIQGLDNVYIRPNGAARLRYSANAARWEMTDLWGSDYFPTLKGNTTRTVQVTPDGYTQAEANVELKTWDLAQSSAFTKADINTAYPSIAMGCMVICPNIAGGGRVYEKYDDQTNDWISYPITKLV